jgi:hypothetical protein
MKKFYSFLLVTLAYCTPSLTAHAQTTIVNYTLGDDTTGTLIPAIGSSISAITWNSGGSEGYAKTFSSQGEALSVNSFELGEYYQITLDATGYDNITLGSFRANGGPSAPKSWEISYSTTGTAGTFTGVSSYDIVSTTAIGATTIPGITLSSNANNNSSIVLRFTATSSTRVDGGAGLANGTARLDNITISGTLTAVPEPSTYAALMGALAFVGVMIVRRRKQITA